MQVYNYQAYKQTIEGYGFQYDPMQHLLRFLLSAALLLGFALYFQMHPALICVLILVLCVILPVYVLWQYAYVAQERAFKEFTMMLQQLAAQFKINPKLLYALEEVRMLCSNTLLSTVDVVIASVKEGLPYGDAMQSLCAAYPFFVLNNLSTLMCAVEEYGAYHFQEGLDMIQDDLDDVIEDMYLHQQELVQIKNKVNLLCLLALFVGVLSKHMLSSLFDFHDSVLYQGTLLVFTSTMLLAMLLAQRSMQNTWLVWSDVHV